MVHSFGGRIVHLSILCFTKAIPTGKLGSLRLVLSLCSEEIIHQTIPKEEGLKQLLSISSSEEDRKKVSIYWCYKR